MIYLDTSALVKLVVTEAESARLIQYLSSAQTPITSALARTELALATARHSEDAALAAREVIGSLPTVTLTDDLLDEAGQAHVETPMLRALDAIHLTCARKLGPATVVVTYDRRMAEAARAVRLAVVAP